MVILTGVRHGAGTPGMDMAHGAATGTIRITAAGILLSIMAEAIAADFTMATGTVITRGTTEVRTITDHVITVRQALECTKTQRITDQGAEADIARHPANWA